MEDDTEARMKADLRRRLSATRYEHSLRVAETAVRMARRHGLDERRAELAGLCHDWARELPDDELIALARTLELPPAPTPSVLHGPVAARLLPDLPGLDAEVRSAVDRHTTGAAGMTPLEMVVYLADLLEPEHDYAGVDELRRLADVDLDAAMLAALDRTILHLVERGRIIDARAVEARNDLLVRRGLGRSRSPSD